MNPLKKHLVKLLELFQKNDLTINFENEVTKIIKIPYSCLEFRMIIQEMILFMQEVKQTQSFVYKVS